MNPKPPIAMGGDALLYLRNLERKVDLLMNAASRAVEALHVPDMSTLDKIMTAQDILLDVQEKVFEIGRTNPTSAEFREFKKKIGGLWGCSQ